MQIPCPGLDGEQTAVRILGHVGGMKVGVARNQKILGGPAEAGAVASEHMPHHAAPEAVTAAIDELAFSWRHQMQPLADAGYHVLAPDQRGYGRTDKPKPVEAYDIVQLTGDLVGLLDHYGYEKALFVGHDWGALVVWAMSVMHPDRVAGVINLSVPYLDRGTAEWVGLWEKLRGDDFYIVHFNRKPGVADAAFAKDPKNLLRNLYRTEQWTSPPRETKPGMAMINLVEEQNPPGRLMMSEAESDTPSTAEMMLFPLMEMEIALSPLVPVT